MIDMKTCFMGFAVAALLVAAPTFPGHAEDAAPMPAPAASSATTPPATPSEPPVSVPRPSILPKAAEPSKPVTTDKPAATDDSTPRRHHRYARRRWHYAYWQPFPIYWPYLYRSHIYWSRTPWFSF
jgi:hypothetical protein